MLSTTLKTFLALDFFSILKHVTLIASRISLDNSDPNISSKNFSFTPLGDLGSITLSFVNIDLLFEISNP